jgi:hypothetical protein
VPGNQEDQGKGTWERNWVKASTSCRRRDSSSSGIKNAESKKTRGWSGLYWARKNAAGDYEVRAVTREGEAYSVTGGIFPKAGLEGFYEEVGP